MRSPDPRNNFNFSRFGLDERDTTRFTLKIAGGVATSVGWGDLRPRGSREAEAQREIPLRFAGVDYFVLVRGTAGTGGPFPQ